MILYEGVTLCLLTAMSLPAFVVVIIAAIPGKAVWREYGAPRRVEARRFGQ
ncbi:hypothetical protein [Kribbella sp. NPDC051137]|jgi:hypothetical protein|uniref:hypothetical protein n=1 Tax=Kribbella sp. NPDC051137 TaxID=3155045 RepID=UPI0034127C6D